MSSKLVKKRKIYVSLFYLAFLILLPIVLLTLPSDFFDQGPSMCLSVLLFNQQCYECGMTGAIQHLIHLDVEGAYFYNPRAFIVLPLLVLLWIMEIRRTYTFLVKNGFFGKDSWFYQKAGRYIVYRKKIISEKKS